VAPRLAWPPAGNCMRAPTTSAGGRFVRHNRYHRPRMRRRCSISSTTSQACAACSSPRQRLRRREHTCADVARASRAFAAPPRPASGATPPSSSGRKTGRVDCRALGCLLQGAMSFIVRASADFLRRVAAIVKSRLC
jgi:hypothetical protein